MPCISSIVNVKPTGVLKLFCEHPNLTWKHVTKILSRPLTSITKGHEYAITCNFPNSIQAGMGCRHCLASSFNDQVNASCIGLLIKGLWFIFSHTEIGGGTSYALLNIGIKTWCATTSSTGKRFFGRFCHSPEDFIALMQRGPREREARYVQLTIQSPGALSYIPHLFAHAVSTLDTGSPTVLS